MCSSQWRYNERKKCNEGKYNPRTGLFFRYVDQKSVNAGQIIPVFTIVWDDD